MKLIFAVLYVSRTMGLTRCYKTEVFFTFIITRDLKLVPLAGHSVNESNPPIVVI